MKGIKKIVLLGIVFTMLLSTFASAAVNFSDLPENWAKEYIVKAAELGLIKGYEDGTFRPKNNVTRMETMLMLSRLYKVNDDIKKQIEDKYVPFIKESTGGKDEWAYNELAMALELKLLSEERFKTLYNNSAIKAKAPREDVAVFVIKALCLQDEVDKLNKSTYTIVFKDAEKITNEYRAYVHLAYEKGIITGDENNYFNPDKFITREQFAAILSRAYDYAVKNNVMPSFDSYDTYENVGGVISKITLNTLESYVEIAQGETEEKRIITLTDKTAITIDGKTSKISDLAVDMTVNCLVNTKTNFASTVNADTTIKTIQGVIKSVYFVPPMQLVITDKANKEQIIDIPDDAVIKYEGKEVAFRELKEANPVVIKMAQGKVTEVLSTSRIKTYTGKITDIIYNIPIKLCIEDTNGAKLEFIYISEPKVVRNEISTTFDQLRIGDKVEIETDNEILSSIKSTSSTEATDTTGTIKEIKIGNSNTISVQNNEGVTTTYKVSNAATISVMNRTSTVYDLRVGYKAKLILNDNEVISIEVTDIENSQEITGKVIYVNLEKKMIMLQTENTNGEKEIVYVNIASDTVIMTIKGQSRTLASISLGDSIISVGSYTGGLFDAVSVIIK